MPFNDERFKNLASGIQSIIVAIAVVIGGLWTFITFNALQTIKSAMLGISEQEKALQQQVSIELEIGVRRIASLPNDNNYLLCAIVSIRNAGNKSTTVNLDPRGPLRVRQVIMNGGDIPAVITPEYHKLLSPGGGFVGGVAIRAQSSAKFPFVIPISKLGLYQISFDLNVPSSDVNADVTKSTMNDKIRDVHWGASAFYVISDAIDESENHELPTECSGGI